MQFHKHIIEALDLEKPRGIIGSLTRYNRPKTINHSRFRHELENLGFTIETTLPKNSEEGTLSREMTISKGRNHISFLLSEFSRD